MFKSHQIAFALLLLAMGCCPTLSRADVPEQAVVTYQGVLDRSGIPLSGTVAMRFRLLQNEAGVLVLATQDEPAVDVRGGLFSVDLAIPSALLPVNDETWIEIEVAYNTTNAAVLQPRTRLGESAVSLFSLATTGGLDAAYQVENTITADSSRPIEIRDGSSGKAIRTGVQSWPFIRMYDGADLGSRPTISLEAGIELPGPAMLMRHPDGSIVADIGYDQFSEGGLLALGKREPRGSIGVYLGSVPLSETGPLLMLLGSEQSIVLNTDRIGDESTQLSSNAINAKEILDEPGVASTAPAGVSLQLDSQITSGVIAEQSIRVPGPGFVVATATCEAEIGVDPQLDTLFHVGLNTGDPLTMDQSIGYDFFAADISAPSVRGLTVTDVFEVSNSGLLTVDFRAETTAANQQSIPFRTRGSSCSTSPPPTASRTSASSPLRSLRTAW